MPLTTTSLETITPPVDTWQAQNTLRLIPLSTVQVNDIIEFGSGYRMVITPVTMTDHTFSVKVQTKSGITYTLSLNHDRDVMVTLHSRIGG